MRNMFFAGLFSLPSIVFAANVSFVGNYGLEFSNNPKEPAVVVSGSDDQLTVKVTGEDDTSSAKIVDAEKMKALWERLSFTNAPDGATCIKFSRDYLCHIDPAMKKTEAGLASIQSEFFFYSITQDTPVTAFPLK